eukprot:TRINITY_DN40814_c0_g1_i1.p1 TRINITY_DN40814_c0_g1~~TRINITY_DN40814_c0_g1_i1.p1  ORF type:complete len:198 (+),score=76.11 TRINITY_DN40814_c0_g1_i1:45-638(+)
MFYLMLWCCLCLFCRFFFFFKQKTAYEMLRSLVGSEMCIRDRYQRRVRGGGVTASSFSSSSSDDDQEQEPCEHKDWFTGDGAGQEPTTGVVVDGRVSSSSSSRSTDSSEEEEDEVVLERDDRQSAEKGAVRSSSQPSVVVAVVQHDSSSEPEDAEDQPHSAGEEGGWFEGAGAAGRVEVRSASTLGTKSDEESDPAT